MADVPIDLGAYPAEPGGPLPSLELGPAPAQPSPSMFDTAASWVNANAAGLVRFVNAVGAGAAGAVAAGGVASSTVQQAVGKAQGTAIDGALRQYAGPIVALVVVGFVYVSLKRR